MQQTADPQAHVPVAIRKEIEIPVASEPVLEESRRTQDAVLGTVIEVISVLDGALEEMRHEVMADEDGAASERAKAETNRH